MSFITRETKKIFDGNEESLINSVEELNFSNENYLIKPKNLKPIYELVQYIKGINFDEIANALGLSITNFDGMKTYHGSKRGLKLYCDIIGDGNTRRVLIFSFGEIQPGRFVCLFEAVFDAEVSR